MVTRTTTACPPFSPSFDDLCDKVHRDAIASTSLWASMNINKDQASFLRNLDTF